MGERFNAFGVPRGDGGDATPSTPASGPPQVVLAFGVSFPEADAPPSVASTAEVVAEIPGRHDEAHLGAVAGGAPSGAAPADV